MNFSANVENGLFPMRGVGRKGSKIFLRTSRSVYLVASLLGLVGLLICFIDAGFPLWVLGVPLLIGSLVGPPCVIYFNAQLSIGFEIDLSKRLARLSRGGEEQILPFDRIIRLEQTAGPVKGSVALKLLYRDEAGDKKEVCLYSHRLGIYARRMARRLEVLIPEGSFNGSIM